MYQAGDLDQLVTIKRAVKTADGAGGYTTVWEDLLPNLPAFVRPLSAREQVQAQQINASALYRFVIRSAYDGAFHEADVAVWNGLIFNIRQVMPFPRSAWLEFVGEKGVAV